MLWGTFSGATGRSAAWRANCEVLTDEVDTSLPAVRVVRVLDRIAEERGHSPEKRRVDNGPEFIGSAIASWPEGHGVAFEVHPASETDAERLLRALQSDRPTGDAGPLCV